MKSTGKKLKIKEQKKIFEIRPKLIIDIEELEKVVKQIIEPLSIETFLRLKGFKLTDKSLCNSGAVWENKELTVTISLKE